MNSRHGEWEHPDSRDPRPFPEGPPHPGPANVNGDDDRRHTDAVGPFRAAMAAEGISTSEPIIPDGRLHRIHVAGDRLGTRNGWYVLHTDYTPAGAFGSWRLGVTETWRAKEDPESASVEVRAVVQARISAAEERRRQEEADLHERTRLKAERIWARAKPAPADHSYLIDKRIKPHELRASCGRLLVPLRDGDGVLRSLEFIGADGSKRFLAGGRVRGCFCLMGSPDGKLFIAEGYATARQFRN
jgi:putative DNA primase/helicase